MAHAIARKPARSARGFLLIEVLVAILIFSFAVLGLIALLASSMQTSIDGENRERAAIFASQIANEMWYMKTVNLPAADVTNWQNTVAAFNVQSGLPNGVGSVSVNGNIAFIQVTWKPPHGVQHQYQTVVQIP